MRSWVMARENSVELLYCESNNAGYNARKRKNIEISVRTPFVFVKILKSNSNFEVIRSNSKQSLEPEI